MEPLPTLSPTGRRGAKRGMEAGPCLGCQENPVPAALASPGAPMEPVWTGRKIMKVHLGVPWGEPSKPNQLYKIKMSHFHPLPSEGMEAVISQPDPSHREVCSVPGPREGTGIGNSVICTASDY